MRKCYPKILGHFVTAKCTITQRHILATNANVTKHNLFFQVGWIKADTKAIQAIGKHVISNNQRITVSHDPTRSKFRLHITGVTLEDAGPYMCQINSLPVKAQVSE